MKEKIILYGASHRGQEVLRFLKYLNMEEIVIGYCDMHADSIKNIGGLDVYSYEKAKQFKAPFVITVISKEVQQEIENTLKSSHIPYYSNIHEWAKGNGIDMIMWNREWCAYRHIDGMNQYFEEAEREAALDMFWDDRTDFCWMFQSLDLDNVIELACGRGRHVQKYEKLAGHITLVDILENNISFCKKRFADRVKISYYRNSGYDLRELQDESYTSLFTYDAMVHFEMLDIYSYLKDIYRVLKKGSYALCHHSNNMGAGGGGDAFITARQGRSFMSKDIFAYMSDRCGFEVIEQKVIDWGNDKNLDCISLIKKKGN